MTRGRAIDKTLPPSRTLTQQRDYRARKAARINELENENEHLKSENERLRKELALIRSDATTLQTEKVESVKKDLESALKTFKDLAGSLGVGTGEWAHIDTLAGHDSARTGSHLHHSLHSHRFSPVPTPFSARTPTSFPPLLSKQYTNSDLRNEPHPSPTIPSSVNDYNPSRILHQPLSSEMHSAESSDASEDQPYTPPYDPTCCDGIFDCSGLLRPEPGQTLTIADITEVPAGKKVEKDVPPQSLLKRPRGTAFGQNCCDGTRDCSSRNLLETRLPRPTSDRQTHRGGEINPPSPMDTKDRRTVSAGPMEGCNTSLQPRGPPSTTVGLKDDFTTRVVSTDEQAFEVDESKCCLGIVDCPT